MFGRLNMNVHNNVGKTSILETKEFCSYKIYTKLLTDEMPLSVGGNAYKNVYSSVAMNNLMHKMLAV